MARREYTFEAKASSTARPAIVFALVSNGPSWSSWAGPLVASSSWARTSQDEPGVGAVRVIGRWPVLLREETTTHEPDRVHGYALRTPGPVKDYVAEVVLTPNAGGGTDIRWHGRFTEVVPGTGKVIQLAVNKLMGSITRRLARAAERV